MTGVQIMQAVIEILVGGITQVAQGIGAGLSTLATSIFLTGTGESQTLSTFGVLIIVFAGISLAIGLSRFIILITGRLKIREKNWNALMPIRTEVRLQKV